MLAAQGITLKDDLQARVQLVGVELDDQGSHCDAQGLLRNWWTPQDRTRFAERTGVLVAQYGGYQPISGFALNGR